MVRRIGEFTLAAGRGGERARHRLRPGLLRVRGDGLTRGFTEACAQRDVVVQAAHGGGERARVARRHDQAGSLLLDDAARGGSYRVRREHGKSLVEGFVDDKPPRLEEVACGYRWYDHNVAARVRVAQFDRIAPAGCECAGGNGPGSDRAVAAHDQRTLLCRET